jgi:hypothetical protein
MVSIARMKHSGRKIIIVTGLTLVLTAALAGSALASGPAIPTGNWRTTGSELKGTFTVTAGGVLKNLHGTIGASAETGCGTGKVALVGSAKLQLDPMSPEWVVGTVSDVIDPVAVTVLHNGKRTHGLFDVAVKGDHGGDIYYDKVASNEGVNGYDCDLQFDVAK